ncbi:elongation factor P [bacterium]|nr:elongation factor P [bacterium]
MVFRENGEHYRVLRADHGKSARQAAFLQAKIRNLATGAVTLRRFSGGMRVERCRLEESPATFLFRQGDILTVMDDADFEQYDLPVSMVGEAIVYMNEDDRVLLTWLDGKIIGLGPTPQVILEVVEAADAVKGDTATGATKEVTLAGGAAVRVPLFVKRGDLVKVDTRTGNYLERA